MPRCLSDGAGDQSIQKTETLNRMDQLNHLEEKYETIEANNKEFERTKGARIKEMQKEYAQKSVNWLK